ncbi:MAG: hypothetical protein WBB48_00660 [Thermodesulfobacteriota bacterium]
MISEELKELIRSPILVQKILWIVIVGSIVFYISFVYIFVGGSRVLVISIGSAIELLIYILAGIAMLGSIFYYRYALSDNHLKKFMSKDVDIELLAKNPSTKEVDTNKLGQLKALSPSELKIYSLMFEVQKITIITLILNELIVIFGSAISFMNDDVSKIVPFGIVSLVLSFWMFPRAQSVIKRVGQLISTNK